jgi:hypothetical protein
MRKKASTVKVNDSEVKASAQKPKKNLVVPEPSLIAGSTTLDNIMEVKADVSDDFQNTDTYSQVPGTRRNRAATITRSTQYANIEGGIVPFIYSGGRGNYTSNISIRDGIILCQKAYYNYPIFRNTIDLMTEFSCSPIYFSGGNAQSRRFFEAWAERVNLWKLQDSFFREYFRSGNVFMYKLNATFKKEDMMTITQLMGATERDVPIRYVVLNPADIQSIGSASFIAPRYVKVLNDFEMQLLTNPKTDEDKELAKKIREFAQIQDTVKISQANAYLVFYLDPDKVKAVFYKKQDYEPFSVPMGFPVLRDINWKQELKNIDMAISRTVQQAVLLVTMGNDEIGMPSKQQIQALTNIFQNESVGRILVADYTTKVQFVIPEIAHILDPKKYEIVDKDIREGLNSILAGNDKYANSQTKVEVFLSRLKHSREAFMNQFLLPEVKEIAKELGFKSVPTPRFTDVDFKDDDVLARTYSRLIEIGVLTPEEGLTAINTGRLPTPEESVENQRKLAEYHNEGLYQPVLNNPNLLIPGGEGAGRPPGTGGTPKAQTKVTPVGKGSPAGPKKKISATRVAENLAKFDLLAASVETTLKDKFNKKKLSKEQKKIVAEVAETIGINESPDKWLESIAEYINNPVQLTENFTEVQEIAEKHGVDIKTALLLMHSEIEE